MKKHISLLCLSSFHCYQQLESRINLGSCSQVIIFRAQHSPKFTSASNCPDRRHWLRGKKAKISIEFRANKETKYIHLIHIGTVRLRIVDPIGTQIVSTTPMVGLQKSPWIEKDKLFQADNHWLDLYLFVSCFAVFFVLLVSPVQ